MGTSNFEGVCLQNNNMAKGYYGLTEKQRDLNGSAQQLKLVY